MELSVSATEMAKNALSSEEREKYKQMGEYMYSDNALALMNGATKPEEKDYVTYAVEAIKSGLDPKDLSEDEIRALISFYGDTWYEKFGFSRDEVKFPLIELVEKPPSESQDVHAGRSKMKRQERRRLEREAEKKERKSKKAEEKKKEGK